MVRFQEMAGTARMLAGLVAVDWLVLVGLLALQERRLIFFPTRDLAADPAAYSLDAEEVSVRTSDGEVLHGWWIAGPTNRVLIWYHGNAGNIADRLHNARWFVEHLGVDVVLVDYRGYGRSRGTPDEAGLYLDGTAIFDAGARPRALLVRAQRRHQDPDGQRIQDRAADHGDALLARRSRHCRALGPRSEAVRVGAAAHSLPRRGGRRAQRHVSRGRHAVCGSVVRIPDGDGGGCGRATSLGSGRFGGSYGRPQEGGMISADDGNRHVGHESFHRRLGAKGLEKHW